MENIYKLIKSPSNLITEIEGDKPNLSYAHTKIETMQRNILKNMQFLGEQDQRTIQAAINRRKIFMFHHAELVAQLINPKSKE